MTQESSSFNPNCLENGIELIQLEYLIKEKEKWLADAKSHVKVLKEASHETKSEPIEKTACLKSLEVASHSDQSYEARIKRHFGNFDGMS